MLRTGTGRARDGNNDSFSDIVLKGGGGAETAATTECSGGNMNLLITTALVNLMAMKILIINALVNLVAVSWKRGR